MSAELAQDGVSAYAVKSFLLASFHLSGHRADLVSRRCIHAPVHGRLQFDVCRVATSTLDPGHAVQVGAALSMVYTSGAPIMFVGCGQTYVDLKRLNTKSVVRSLLK